MKTAFFGLSRGRNPSSKKNASRKPDLNFWRLIGVIFTVAALLAAHFSAAAAMFTNGGFETGTLDDWTVSHFSNSGLRCTTGGSCIVRSSGGTDRTSVVGAPGISPMTQADAHSPILYPRFGSYSALVNYAGASRNANSLKQRTKLTNADIDPADGKIHIRFAYAPVLENPGHVPSEQPYFYIGVKNTSQGITLYDRFAFSGQSGVPWKDTGTGVLYTDWQIVDIPLESNQWSKNDWIELEVIAAGCSRSGHFGYVYVDAFGAFLPGMSVYATGPETIRRGQNLTYTYHWANTGSAGVNNVVLTAEAPANTTYGSDDAGCTLSGSTVTCSLGNKNPGEQGSVQITYLVSLDASGTINHGDYRVEGEGFPAITGPLVTTTVSPEVPPAGFTSEAPADGSYGAPYSHDFEASGIPVPTFELAEGSLPPGLSLDPLTGLLSGVPTAAGSYSFSVRAVNSSGSYTQAYTLEIHKGGTQTSVTSLVGSPVYGQTVSLSASVSPTVPGSSTPSGQVQFSIDAVPVGSPVDLNGGTATVQLPLDLGAGEHTALAFYAGDANFSQSESPAFKLVVGKADTRLSLESSLNPAPFGVPVMVTAALTAVEPSAAVPGSGLVQFRVDGVTLDDLVALTAGGTASLQIPYSVLGAGVHEITAFYAGETNFNPSSNQIAPLMQDVEKGDLIVTLGATLQHPVFGQAVGFTTQLAGAGSDYPLPTGTVQFLVDGLALGDPVSLDASGAALSETTASLSTGAHTVQLDYSGDGTYRPATVSLPSGVVVEKAAVLLKSDSFTPAGVVVGQPLVISFSVQAGPPGAGRPTGPVTVSYAGGSCSEDASAGLCELIPVHTTGAGSSLSLVYGGDENFLSQEASLFHGPAVDPAGVNVTITGASGPVVFGQSYSVQVQVEPEDPGSLIPAGRPITISNGTDTCTAIVQPEGSAECEITPTSTGEQILIAQFDGGSDYQNATSEPTQGETVNPAETTTTLTTGANPVLEGSVLRLNAAVGILPPGQGKLSGNVQFQIDGQNLGDPVTLMEGAVASLETDDLAPGVYAVSVVYLGDGNFRSSTSAALSLTVLSGDLSLDVTPEEGGEIVYHGEHNGQPVETRILIPAGAVDRKLTLVFRQFYNTTLTPPSGKDFVILFSLEAYVDGVKQEAFEFLKPLTLTMGYNPETWDENSLDLAGWDGSRWNAGGLTLLNRAPGADTIALSLAGVGPDPFALVGTHAYPLWLPVMLSGGR